MSNGHVEVRLRDGDNAEGQRLCEWPADSLERLIGCLRNWGVLAAGDSHDDFYGQFVLDESGAYFEVVIAGDGE